MITATSLREQKNNAKSKIRANYKVLLGACMKRITNINNQGISHYHYKIPRITPGMPLYDTSKALKYIQKKLISAGFNVYVTSEISIFIDWSVSKS